MEPSNNPPATDPAVQPASDEPQGTYVDQTARVARLRWLLRGYIGAAGLYAVVAVVGLVVVAIAGGGTSAADWAAAITDVVSLVPSLVFLVTIFVFAPLLYRASHNARALSPRRFEYGPIGIVLWYFVPILNLINPFSAVREVWRASQPRVPPLLWRWWLLYIVSAGTRQATLGAEAAGPIGAEAIELLAAALSIALGVAARAMVAGLHDVQQRHFETGSPVA